jgi:hypothetical protein
MRLHARAGGLDPGTEQECKKQNTPNYHAAHTNLNIFLTI